MRAMDENRLKLPLLLGLLLLLALAGLWLWPHGQGGDGHALPPPPELAQILLKRPVALAPFTLHDQDGQPFTAANLRGQWSFVFFGYTHCPDICPTTLLVLKGVKALLEKNGDAPALQYLFVSVDPKRDTPEVLRDYVHYFDRSFIGASGERAQLDALSRQMGFIYAFEGDTESDEYVVNHSAMVLLVDPEGRLYARFNTPYTPDGMAAAFRRIHTFYQQQNPNDR